MLNLKKKMLKVVIRNLLFKGVIKMSGRKWTEKYSVK